MLGCHVLAACFCAWPVCGFFDLFLPVLTILAFFLTGFVQGVRLAGLSGLLAAALEALGVGWLETG